MIFDFHVVFFAVPSPWNSLSSVLHMVVIRMSFPHLLLPVETEGPLMVVVLRNLSMTLHQGLTSQGHSPGCSD